MERNGMEQYLAKVLSLAESESAASSDAKKLASAFSSFSNLAHKDSSVLQILSGCGEKSAEFIRLLVSLNARRITDEFKIGKRYSEPEIRKYVCALLFHLTVESVYMISFDKAGRLTAADLLTEGTVNSSAFLPRKMVDIALKRRAASVVLAHNHPSGNIMPSENDVAVTLLAKSVLGDAHVELKAHYVAIGFKVVDCLQQINESPVQKSEIIKINPRG